MTIPKIIHYCWFGGGPMKPLALRCMESWKTIGHGYEIRRWDESNSPLSEPCFAQLLRFKKYAFASDFVRAWALEREGGIYLDVDVEMIRPFDQLLEESAFLGFQEERPGGHWLNAAVLGSEPGHWFVREWIALYRRAHRTRLKPYIVPEICTKILTEEGLSTYQLQTIRGVKICPTDWFYPYHMDEAYSPACHTKNTVAIHHWANDWGSGAHRKGWAKLPYLGARLLSLLGW